MTNRKSLTGKLALEICMRQIAAGHVVHAGGKSYHLACPLCHKRIDIMAKVIREHMKPIALGGADDATNQYFVHKGCAKTKTSGNGATTHGSDIGDISKTKRLEKAREALERGDAPKPKKKIANRGWDRRYRKKLNGQVERTDA